MRRGLPSSVLVAVLLVAPSVFAQSKAKAENVPEIPYESVPNFLKLPPNLYLGEGIGVATNSKGHVFVYTRSADTRLFEFDQNGNFVREIGQGLYGFEFAHAVRVDREDNVWTVDEGTNMVIKFNPEGRVAMVIGRRPEAVEGLAAVAPGARPLRRSRTCSAVQPMSDGTPRATSSSPTGTAIHVWRSSTGTAGSSSRPAHAAISPVS